MPENDEKASFGFATVPKHEKAARVRGVFDAVAARYDLMNDLMSGGVHRLWKVQMMDWLSPRPGMRLLDVAGGTGDIARLFLKRTARPGKEPARAVICDINASMLTAGRNRGTANALLWVCGDAERLPFPERSFDAYTIAFGIRNVTDLDAALGEAKRVLKPGGRFLCLEFGAAAVPGLDRFYEAYSFNVIPALGGLVTGDEAAYRYLVESIRRFPSQKAFAARVTKAGLGLVKIRNLSGGIAALTSAWRLA